MANHNGNGKAHIFGTPAEFTANDWNEFQSLVMNVEFSRQQLMSRLFDKRRKVEDECGYPVGESTPQQYQDLYDYFSIAARVVELYPKECWQVQPTLKELGDPANPTPFEVAWRALGKGLRGDKSYFRDEEGSPVWEYLKRLDVMSGIGRYGVMLLGLDDGLPLHVPAAGFEEQGAYPAGTKKLEGGRVEVMGSPWRGDGKGAAYTNNEKVTYNLMYEKGDPGNLPYKAGTDPRKTAGRKLTYLRVFPEALAPVTRYETNPTSPRYGQPAQYQLTFHDPQVDWGFSAGIPLSTMDVHWSRVIHAADTSHQAGSSDWFAPSRMRVVRRELLDLVKMYGASAEGFWLACITYIAFSTHPQLGGNVPVNVEKMKDMWERMKNSMDRAAILKGMSMESVAPSITDPTPHLDKAIEAICIVLGCPIRVFKGSERGELASSQDDAAWNDRLRARQRDYVTPRIIAPFVDRLITLGVLPPPDAPQPVKENPAQLQAKKKEAGAGGTPPGTGGEGGENKAVMGGKEDPKAKGKPASGKKAPEPAANSLTVHALETGDDEEDAGTEAGGTAGDYTDPEAAVEDKAGETGLESTPQADGGEAEKGYTVDWPDLTSQSEAEEADVANKWTTAMAAYVSGGLQAFITPLDYLVSFMGFDEDEARHFLENTRALGEVQAELDAEAEAEAMELQAQKIKEGLVPDPTDPGQNPAGGQGPPAGAGGFPPKPGAGAGDPKPKKMAVLANAAPAFHQIKESLTRNDQYRGMVWDEAGEGWVTLQDQYGWTGIDFGLVLANGDPNQPRDKDGQWTAGPGGKGPGPREKAILAAADKIPVGKGPVKTKKVPTPTSDVHYEQIIDLMTADERDQMEEVVDFRKATYGGDSDKARRGYLMEFYEHHGHEMRFKGETKLDAWGEDGLDKVHYFDTSAGNRYELYAAKREAVQGAGERVPVREIGFKDAGGSYEVTGAGGAAEVFTKVTAAVVALAQKEDLPAMSFSAAEPSRQKLYDRLVKTVAKVMPDYAAIAVEVAGSGGRKYFVVKREHAEAFKKKAGTWGYEPEVLVNAEAVGPELNPDWFTPAGWPEFGVNKWDPNQPRDPGGRFGTFAPGPDPEKPWVGKWPDGVNVSGYAAGVIKDKHGAEYAVHHAVRRDPGTDEVKHVFTVGAKGGKPGVDSIAGAETGWNKNRIMSVEVRADKRRLGIASALYAHIEKHLGALYENAVTTDDGKAFWESRVKKGGGPAANYDPGQKRDPGGEGGGQWTSGGAGGSAAGHQPGTAGGQPKKKRSIHEARDAAGGLGASGGSTWEGVPKAKAKAMTREEAKAALTWHDDMTVMAGTNGPNKALPDEARPALSDEERGALQKYSYRNDGPLNARLRGNPEWADLPPKPGTSDRRQTPYNEAFFDEMHAQMESAFAKAPVLKKPVQVVRGMQVDDPKQLEAMIGDWQGAAAAGNPVQFKGYTSTAVPGGLLSKMGLGNPVPGPFRGNVTMKINAVHGLDMKPHSQLTGEGEFLLPHGARFKVKSIVKKKDGWHVELDQLPPEGK